MRNIIFFDVDDTLIHHRGDISYIPNSTINTIKQLQSKGNIVAIASGRSYTQIQYVMDLLNIKHAVCFNGHMLVVDHKVVYKEMLNKKDMIRLIKQVRGNIYPAIAMDEEAVYIKDLLGKVRKAITTGLQAIEGEPHNMFTGNIMKLKLVDISYYSFVFFNKRFNKEKTYPNLSFRKWGEKGIEVANKGTSKLSGVLELANRFNIEQEHIYVFGDNYNDIEMLSGIGNSVAMGNSVDEAKEAAAYVTTHIGEQGVENACYHFNLI